MRIINSFRQRSQNPRLLCPNHDCRSTFPRNYELQRHLKNVHYRTFSLLCPVYGCNRSSKPFGRLDKFHEHWRKHEQPDKLLCPIESCRAGPLCTADFRNHLKTCHRDAHLHQAHLDDILRTIDCNLKIIPIQTGLLSVVDRDACPLAFLGCSFRSTGHPLRRAFRVHITGHELIERAKGFCTIVAIFGNWISYGVASCPVCTQKVCGPDGYDEYIIKHLCLHTKSERAMHAREIREMLQPYLSGKATLGVHWQGYIQEIREGLEEGGFLLPTATKVTAK